MHSTDVLSRPSRQPDLVLIYGPGSDQVADLRLSSGPQDTPGSERPSPLVIFFHGGFWRAAHDRAHVGPLAEALAQAGFIVCAPEYRRVGQPGGGWPGTLDDVAMAMQALPGAVATATGGRTDASRVIVAGHSAGGHLALWAAANNRVGPPAASRMEVVSLAGVCDLANCYRDGLGDHAAAALMGGGPEEFPDRYAAADPIRLLPIGTPISLVHGLADDRVPWQQSQEFAAKALAAGDQADCALLDGYGHFELIDPRSAAWPSVLAAFQSAAARLVQT